MKFKDGGVDVKNGGGVEKSITTKNGKDIGWRRVRGRSGGERGVMGKIAERKYQMKKKKTYIRY